MEILGSKVTKLNQRGSSAERSGADIVFDVEICFAYSAEMNFSHIDCEVLHSVLAGD